MSGKMSNVNTLPRMGLPEFPDLTVTRASAGWHSSPIWAPQPDLPFAAPPRPPCPTSLQRASPSTRAGDRQRGSNSGAPSPRLLRRHQIRALECRGSSSRSRSAGRPRSQVRATVLYMPTGDHHLWPSRGAPRGALQQRRQDRNCQRTPHALTLRCVRRPW